MKLYERDYTNLTTDEEAEWDSVKSSERINSKSGRFFPSKFREWPKAARHYNSLFPNNYLDPVDLKNEEILSEKIILLENALNSTLVTEREILYLISQHEAYFIIGSILKKYFDFGHHDAFLFPEFQLGNSYKADYLIIGKSSGGWEFVFVELEAPRGQIVVKDGEFGAVIRKGITQVKNWDSWLEAQFGSLRETFDKCRLGDNNMPTEFYILDKSRLHYVVIAGFRKDFKDKTYRERRSLEQNSLLVLHYDNLIDCARDIIGQSTY